MVDPAAAEQVDGAQRDAGDEADADPAPPRSQTFAREPVAGLASIGRGWAGLRRQALLAVGYSALLFGGLALYAGFFVFASSRDLDLGAGWIAVSVAWHLPAITALLGLSRLAVGATRNAPLAPQPAGLRGAVRAVTVVGIVIGLQAALAVPVAAPVQLRWWADIGQLALLPVQAVGSVMIVAGLIALVDLDAAAIDAVAAAWRLLRGRRRTVLLLAVSCAVLWAALSFASFLVASFARTLVQTAEQRDADFAGTVYAIGFGALAGVGPALTVFWFGLAGVCASAADQVALTSGRAELAGGLLGPERPRREWLAAALLLVPLGICDPGTQSYLAGELETRLGATLPGSGHAAVTALVLSPLALALALLLAEHRRRAATIDDAGLLLGPTPRWPGDRVRWEDLRGFRVVEGGVRLRVRGAWLDPIVPVTEAALSDLVALLEARGVPRLD